MKKFALGLAVALALVGFASSAKAATVEELQAQIDALLAQLSSVSAPSSTTCYAFTRDLMEGASGADVTALQNFLAGKGYFSASATGFFGPITKAAVSAWQSASGVSPAAGYFGSISRAKYNAGCSTTTGGNNGGNDDNGGFNSGNGDEATLSNFDTKSGDDTDLEEGQDEGQILDFKFKVEDADVEVQRVQVNFEFAGTNAGEDKPWKTFTGAHLMVDGDEVASVDDVSDKDTWSDEGSDEYSIRFNSIDEVVKAGDTAEFTVAMDVNDSVDGTGTAGANDWTVSVDTDEVRALDEAGIDQYIGDSSDTVDISIDQSGQNNELNVTESDDNPDSEVLEVSDTETSDWMTVGVMQLSPEGDILLNDLNFAVLVNQDVTPADEVYSDVVNDAQILIDGQEYSDFTVNGAGTATATLTFDLSDEDLVLSDGEDVNVEVQLEFKKQSGNYDEGTTVTVEASSTAIDNIDAEGEADGESLDTTQLKGSFEGDTHTLRNEGIMITLGDMSAESPIGGDEAQANFEIEFTVEAFGADFWVEKTAANDATPDGSDGVEFSVEDSGGTATSGASVSATLNGGSAKSGDNSYGYKVSEGSTRTFKALVTFDNDNVVGGAGYYRLQINGISFDADGVAGSEQTITTGLEDYETDDVYVSNDDVAN